MKTSALSLQTRTEFSRVMGELLKRLGAVRVRVGPKGIASHWATQFEASVACDKFRSVGLQHVETFSDNGLFAAFAKFPG